jgi:amidase
MTRVTDEKRGPGKLMETWQMSATEVARLVREKTVSAREVAEAHISRIDSVNPKLNAIVLRTDDALRSAAAAVDDGTTVGPLAGAVVTTKINTDHAPYPSDNGIKSLRDNVPGTVHPSITGLLDAGLMMAGRTNSPAFAMRFHTANDLHGETMNPHREDISPGGSSGGAGVAVATGMCHIAQGNDVAGSVRWPAYMNGVLGLRPTVGRMPTGGTNPNPRTWTASAMSTNGPLARTMADLRAGYRAMCVQNWNDPFWVPVAHEFPAPTAPIRVALVVNDEIGVHPAVQDALRRVGSLLEDAGYEVEEVSPPMLDVFFELWQRVGSPDIMHGLMSMLDAIDDSGLTATMNDWRPSFPEPTSQTFIKAMGDRDMLMRAWNVFFSQYPLMVTPMMAEPTMTRGYDKSFVGAMASMSTIGRWGMNLSAISIPALAFPVGMHEGAPLGVQVTAHTWREDLILAAGDALEARLGPVGAVDTAW